MNRQTPGRHRRCLEAETSERLLRRPGEDCRNDIVELRHTAGGVPAGPQAVQMRFRNPKHLGDRRNSGASGVRTGT